MESHEWFENTDEGKVYYRANYYLSGKWTIMTTTQKRNPTWTDVTPPTEEALRELRDIVPQPRLELHDEGASVCIGPQSFQCHVF